MPSRGNAISAYSAPFARGAKVYGDNIQSGVITSAHIADGTVVAAEVAAGAITSAKIGTGAVTSIKLGAASVISAKIGTGAVLATSIGAGAVISAKIGAGAVLAVALAAGAVTSAKIGTAAVTNAKMKAAFLSGTISGLTSGVVAVAHGLGVAPKFVVATMLATHADIIAGTAKGVYVAAASAATTTNIYLKTLNGGNVKYVAYVQI